jgi:cytochrome c oxidase subunit II
MGWFILVMSILAFVLIFQIAKASEYVSMLKGEKKAQEQSNKVNGFLMLAFLVLGLVGVYYCHELLVGRTLGESASVEGEEIDRMLIMTLWITGSVCLLTQIILFVFAYKYQYNENRKSYFFSHSSKLEIIWTSIPAVAMTVLVVYGLIHWFKITGDAPKDALRWEITGKQFGWIYRHPGTDNQFGKKDRYKIAGENTVGVDFADVASKDDVMVSDAIHCYKGKTVELIINSRDVIHDVGLVHFRLKMDAVPGMPTYLTFTPKFSTKEMKEKYGSKFEYEISCDQLCGASHYSMKGLIIVHETEAEYREWEAKQKTLYASMNPPATPAATEAPTTPGATPVVAPINKVVDSAKVKPADSTIKKTANSLRAEGVSVTMNK